MRINSIINRYIFKEMIPPFVINLVFLTFIFLMTRILDITHLIVSYRVSLWKVLLVLAYTMPFFLQFVIPMSIMMAVLLTFLRLSSDNEIVAFKAAGVSIYRLLPPVLFFGLIAWLITSFMSIYGLPWGRLSLKELTFKIASSNIGIGLKERTFNDDFKDVMIYVNQIDLKNKVLINVFIEDQRNPKIVSTVVAPKGVLLSDPANLRFHMRLFNGSINQVNLESRTAHNIKFDNYDINLDLKKIAAAAKSTVKDEEEMNLAELRQAIRTVKKKDDQYYLTLMEFHKKFSVPFSCFVFALLGVPLGIQSKTAKRSYGIGLGLVFFLFNYVLMAAGWVFGEAGVYPPLVGMWVPNIVIGGIGLYLLVKVANERPVRVDFVFDVFKKAVLFFRKKKRITEPK